MPTLTTALAPPSPCGRRRALIAGAMLLVLAGCASTDEFAPPCPQVQLLPDAQDLTVFSGTGRDVTDVVFDGRISAVRGSCTKGSTSQTKASMQVAMTIQRGPKLLARSADVPYLITVTEGDRILDQRRAAIRVLFPPNVDQVTVTDAPTDLVFPVTAQKSAAAYTIYVSFVLTQEQLAFNRARGPR